MNTNQQAKAQILTWENRIELALDLIGRQGATDAAVVRAAYQYGVDRETLEVRYDRRYKDWAADRGYDF